jgi:putative two-component system response regulator
MTSADTHGAKRSRILAVDDDSLNLQVTHDLLQAKGYEVRMASNADEARGVVDAWQPDLILLDVIMPGKTGIEFCRELKSDPRTRLVPVVLVTGQTDRPSRLKGIEAGADDFLNKPADPGELLARVRSLIRLKQYTDELDHAESVLFALALGIEARDPYTEGHCHRLALNAAQLGNRLGLDEVQIIALRRGGILHDIGKIAVPDSVLKKPGGLGPEEWESMRRHPVIGEEICRPLRSLASVLPIIRHHHEHWNGRGYPDGLAGEQIPLLARVLQVADAYDALTTDRPYKAALSHEQARDQLLREAQRGWWDAEILRTFLRMMEERDDAARKTA